MQRQGQEAPEEIRGNIMFGILGDLTKAVVGVVIETPIAIAADIVTMAGLVTDKDEPYTATALKGVMQNVENATKPDIVGGSSN